MTRTSMMACLVLFAASGAMAQTNAGKAGGINLDPGSSGGTAGLISGGGTVSSNLDARDNRPGPDARAGDQRKQAKGPMTEEQTASKTRSTATRARAEANEEDRNSRPKKTKKQPGFFGYPYVYPNGFATFGTRYTRSRD